MSDSRAQIGIRELRQHASRYIELVERGQTIEITRHGRPVARLVGAEPGARRPAHELIAPADDPAELLDVIPAPAPPPGTPTASEELARMREDERW